MSDDTKTVQFICEFSVYNTASACDQLKTFNGYKVSTSEPVHITPMTDSKSIFVTEIIKTCEGLCFFPREKEGASF